MRRISSAALRAAAVLALAATTGPGPSQDAAAQDCDCSCDSYAGLKASLEKMNQAAESGEMPVMTPELQKAAVCAGQCAMQWANCGDAAGGAGAAGQDDTGTEPADGGGTQAATEAEAAHPLGEPRGDLERFYGVYGDGSGSGRDFFVTAARRPEYAEKQLPEGYLMIGAMWGDVAPWHMKSLSETRFQQHWVNPGNEPIVARFELDGEGHAAALIFETVFDDRGRLQRVGDLPERW